MPGMGVFGAGLAGALGEVLLMVVLLVMRDDARWLKA
jgi:Na+-driven multidrug efflux pump